MPWTEEELEAIRKADEEIDAEQDWMSVAAFAGISRELDAEARAAVADPQKRKRAEYNRRYCAAHREEKKEYSRRYYAAHGEEKKEYSRRYYAAQKSANGPCDELRQWRKQHGYTQRDVARILGVSQGTISHYETGASPCDFSALVAVHKKSAASAAHTNDSKQKMSTTVYHRAKGVVKR